MGLTSSRFRMTNYRTLKNKLMKNTLSRLMNGGYWLNLMLAAVAHFKARWTAKPFDIWKEKQDDNRKAYFFLVGDWISDDGNLYYGHPLFIFFESAQNSWWRSSNSR